MATAVGTNVVTSLSRRYILPTLVDVTYNSNLFFFRMNARNRKVLQGGYQVEVPIVYKQMAAGGFYQGFDLLDTSPSDTVLNAAWDWRQAEVPVSIDGLTLIRADSPEAVVNLLQFLFEQAQVQLADILGVGVWSDAKTNLKSIDGLAGAIDDGTNTGTYGGIVRSTNAFWKSTIQAYSTPFPTNGLSTMQTLFGTLTQGGRHPTIIPMTQGVYNLYWQTSTSGQSFPVQPQGHDEQLAQNGFTNLLFNGVPVVVDSHMAAVSPNSIYMINEDYLYLYVNPRADFSFREFREPINQDAMVAFVLWAGNLICTNPARQGKILSVTT
jgi:hypothetical protein